VMEGRWMKRTSVSSRMIYIRSTADITSNWNHMRNAAYMNELSKIRKGGHLFK